MKHKLTLLAVISVLLISCQQPANQQKINLSGEWNFAIDSLDQGISGKWFDQTLADHITLPGSMTSNGKGDDITLKTPWTGQIVDSSYFKKPEYAKYRQPGNIKIPFWLQPLKYYKGAAWYQKEVTIPENWSKKHIRLFLERCHWESRLWVDDREAGMQNSLGTPHQYDLSALLTPGKYRLTLCIDNRIKDIDPGINSHSISDHTQTNWNGVVGQLFLEAQPRIFIQNIQVFPDIQNKLINAKIKVENTSGEKTAIRLQLKADGSTSPESQSSKFELTSGENVLNVNYPMGDDVRFWNEFHPEVYRLTAVLSHPASGENDTCRTTFGMREIKVEGKHILINGQQAFLRGTLECAIFPKTGYPPTDVDAWLRIFRICRAHGLNHMRFHSWCPPEAAFEAADQTGFYLHVECSSWANGSTTLGDGKPFDKYLYEESQRMEEAYGNHPSFCMMAYGNEPGGNNYAAFLTDFVNFWKNRDSRRIYTSGAGWPNLPVNDYLSDSNPRIQRWGEGLKSIINAKAPSTDYDWSDYIKKFKQPMISHEIGQWCVYPDFKEIAQYDGVLRARNFEIFRETLKEHGMEQLADSFLLASGKLQALCYKADIEAALRTKDFGGFQLLDLHDFPGQGTALVGVLNAFWGEKGYISPEEYRRFCNSTVPLARLKKRVFTNNEQFEATAEVAHFGEKPISGCTPEWKVTDENGEIIQSGELPKTNIPIGNGIQLGKISFSLASILNPEKLTLEIAVDSLSNSWDFWVYPVKKETISGAEKIRVVQKPDTETMGFLKNGGTVLLTLKQGTLSPEMGGTIRIGFSSIFWNTAWTHGQAPHTLGILCNPNHPALAEFPTEYHSNWQWWDAMSHSGAIDLTSFPKDIKPIVRVIDDWFTNRPLALIFEAKVGKGKLLVSGIDLTTDLAKRPEAQQLFFSLKKYMAGPEFNPKTEMQPDNVRALCN
jgi:hypothetical protein